jgi:superfamily II DNA or RNA helicase
VAERVHHGARTLRARIPRMPELNPDPSWLRDAQARAIRNLERSLKDNHTRAVIRMATGSGKTFAAANICERLIRHAHAKRILFLVDRGNLGKQTLKEFQGFEVPGSGRKFTELYNVQHLTHNHIDPVASVCISTIQRVYSMLRGDPDLAEDINEASSYELVPDRPVEVDYQPELPIDTFDVIIVDECHRSIYGVWRQVLEYFDAFLIGLTATPGKQTFGFFNKNLVMEYGFPEAVADGVNVDFDVFRLSTAISEAGSTIEAGYWTTENRRQRHDWERRALDELRDGHPAAAVNAYAAAGGLVLAATADEARDRLVDDWWEARQHGCDGLMLAARRSDVDDLNDRARARLAAAGALIGPALTVGGREYRRGDDIVTLHNDRRLGVLNGTRAHVVAVDREARCITARTNDGRDVQLPEDYLAAGHVAHGYASAPLHATASGNWTGQPRNATPLPTGSTPRRDDATTPHASCTSPPARCDG